MTLNQPCYSLGLCAPPQSLARDHPEAPQGVWLILQSKLFSGIGGAGLLYLDGIPSVRIVREVGAFSREEWHHRADFQRDFARHNARRLQDLPWIRIEPLRHFTDTTRGWV
jgi:hypothetical protein